MRSIVSRLGRSSLSLRRKRLCGGSKLEVKAASGKVGPRDEWPFLVLMGSGCDALAIPVELEGEDWPGLGLKNALMVA